METFKVYKHEAVTSSADVQAESAEQALKFARASAGLPAEPQYTELGRRQFALTLSPTIERKPRAKKEEEPTIAVK